MSRQNGRRYRSGKAPGTKMVEHWDTHTHTMVENRVGDGRTLNENIQVREKVDSIPSIWCLCIGKTHPTTTMMTTTTTKWTQKRSKIWLELTPGTGWQWTWLHHVRLTTVSMIVAIQHGRLIWRMENEKQHVNAQYTKRKWNVIPVGSVMLNEFEKFQYKIMNDTIRCSKYKCLICKLNS